MAGRLLLVGSALSATAAAVHLGVIAIGGPGYRALGAGEELARASERGSPVPALITAGVAAVLGVAAGYAASGAGLMRHLPLLRTGLVAITGVYLLRGAVLFQPSLLRRPDLSASFVFWSSLIVLGIGLVHALGVWRAWPTLGVRMGREGAG